MRTALATLVVLTLVTACAGSGQPPAGGTYAAPAGSCLDNPEGQAYLKSVWDALQAAWVLPKGVPSDQRVEVTLQYDAWGKPWRSTVVNATDAALRESVEKAVSTADLPATPDALHACLAGQRLSGTFRNPDLSRR
jgi:hypothetical protein